MKRFILHSLYVLAAFTAFGGAAAPARAEKADSEKPSVVNANNMTYDDVRQVNTFTGDVVMTRGTLIMKAEKVVVTTDPDGYQFATLYAGPGKKATFRQKRDGGPDLWIEGEAADRIEYDGKTEIAKLFSKAQMRRLDGTKITDEVHGEFISYDSRAEYYSVNNTVTGATKPGGGRITAVIQPRIQPGASTPAGSPNAPRTTTVIPAPPAGKAVPDSGSDAAPSPQAPAREP